MLNCWRQDPHRRPTFERVLNAITNEVESTLSSTPQPPQPTETPLEPTRTDHEIPGCASRVDQIAPSSRSPEISRQAYSTPPGYDASAFLEAGPAHPRLSHHLTAPGESARQRIPRVDSSPTNPVEITSREKRTGTGSNDKEPLAPPAPANTSAATTRAELMEMGASLGRSASFQVPGAPQHPQQQRQYVRTNSEDSVMQKAKALSRGGKRGMEKALLAADGGAASGMSSGPDEDVPRPAADGHESGKLEDRESPAALGMAVSKREPQGPRVRERTSGRGGEARAGIEPLGGAGEEQGRRARGGRQRDAGRVRPKKNRNVQVVHGFRLTTPAADGGVRGSSSSGV